MGYNELKVRLTDYLENVTLRSTSTPDSLRAMPLSNLAVHIQRTARHELPSGCINALGVLLRDDKAQTVEALATLLALTTKWRGSEADQVRNELKVRLMTFHDDLR